MFGLAVTAVPAAGWFVEGWSAGTTLAVYWFETVAVCLFVAIRIAVHQRLSPRRGHFRYRAAGNGRTGAQNSTFLHGFLLVSLAFCGAHGLFLGVILLLLNHNGARGLADVDWCSAGAGCLLVLVFVVVDFVVDLPLIRAWPFLRVEQTAERVMGRVIVVHLTLILGMLAVAVTGAPTAFFGVFVALRTLYSLSLVLPQWDPARPPDWLSRMMNRVPNVRSRDGERFEEFWAKDRADEADRRRRNEEPWPQRR
ncbi:hypothetical protein MLIT_11710 [Mycolicibacterium litorale]|uniref:Uncharacterized protein n=1 Tax=Mycolicibacterium litorale TaxID=758802 RepID=A0AAD1IHJ1_9MYCO|nr:hypothetical protein MLIT_11710 [Mycolicibacterium litorale]